MIKLDINIIFRRLCKTAFYFLYALFIALLFLRHYFGVDFPVAVYLAVIALASASADKNKLIALAISCVCFPAVFQYKYAIIIIMFAYFFKNVYDFRYTVKYGKSNYSALVLFAIMAIWEFLHVAVFSQSVSEFFRSFVEIAFVFMLIVDSRKNFDYPFVARIVALSSIASCALILLLQMKYSKYPSIVDYFAANRFGYGVEQYSNFDAGFNPNGLGLICVVSVCTLLQLMITRRSKPFDYLMLVTLFTFSLMTMSRKVVLMYAILFLFAFFYLMNIKKRGAFRSIMYLALIGLAVWIAYLILNALLPTVIQRFVDRFNVEDITNGREDIFGAYNDLIARDLGVSLFGWGVQGIDANHLAAGIKNVTHNGIQEVFVCWGVEGIILFAVYLAMLVRRSYNFKKNILNFLVLAEVFAFSQFAQSLRSSLVMMFFGIAYLDMCHNFETAKKPSDR